MTFLVLSYMLKLSLKIIATEHPSAGGCILDQETFIYSHFELPYSYIALLGFFFSVLLCFLVRCVFLEFSVFSFPPCALRDCLYWSVWKMTFPVYVNHCEHLTLIGQSNQCIHSYAMGWMSRYMFSTLLFLFPLKISPIILVCLTAKVKSILEEEECILPDCAWTTILIDWKEDNNIDKYTIHWLGPYTLVSVCLF